MKQQRMLIFGGSFNPIHFGHLLIANRIRERYLFEKVYFLPAGNAPHKDISYTNKYERLLLLKLATQDNKYFEILDNEILVDEVSYTVNTIKDLYKKYSYPKITFIMGADMFMTIEKWKNPKELLELIDVIVATRQDDRVLEHTKYIEEKYNANIKIFSEIETSINSSYIRERIGLYESIKYLVPENVRQYIIKENLYINPEDVIFNNIMKDLEQNISKKRFSHTQGVIHTALEIGAYHNIPFGKIRLASCAHDFAKEFSNQEMLVYIEENDIKIDERAKDEINLLHGAISAIIMKNMYGVTDEDVLNAIENHTFGRVGMSDLELLIAVSDIVEPCRDFNEKSRIKYNKIKELAKTSLTDAYYLKLQETVKYLKKKKKKISPKTLEILNYYKNLYENKGELNDTIERND